MCWWHRLSGTSPFIGRTTDETYLNITQAASAGMSSDVWELVSDVGKDWISKLLVKDCTKRLTISEALAHPWLNVSHCQSIACLMFNTRSVKLNIHICIIAVIFIYANVWNEACQFEYSYMFNCRNIYICQRVKWGVSIWIFIAVIFVYQCLKWGVTIKIMFIIYVICTLTFLLVVYIWIFIFEYSYCFTDNYVCMVLVWICHL